MLAFPLVDTHVHLWDPRRLSYPWLAELPALHRPFLPDDYRAACGPYQVGRMVFVQCEADPAQYRQETAWISELAQHDPRIGAIVSWAPLSQGEAGAGRSGRAGPKPLGAWRPRDSPVPGRPRLVSATRDGLRRADVGRLQLLL